MNKNHPLMQLARRAKRTGVDVEVVLHGLKPEYSHYEAPIRAEYERFKPRKKAK